VIPSLVVLDTFAFGELLELTNEIRGATRTNKGINVVRLGLRKSQDRQDLNNSRKTGIAPVWSDTLTGKESP